MINTYIKFWVRLQRITISQKSKPTWMSNWEGKALHFEPSSLVRSAFCFLQIPVYHGEKAREQFIFLFLNEYYLWYMFASDHLIVILEDLQYDYVVVYLDTTIKTYMIIGRAFGRWLWGLSANLLGGGICSKDNSLRVCPWKVCLFPWFLPWDALLPGCHATSSYSSTLHRCHVILALEPANYGLKHEPRYSLPPFSWVSGMVSQQGANWKKWHDVFSNSWREQLEYDWWSW